jgi:hypothetical protein
MKLKWEGGGGVNVLFVLGVGAECVNGFVRVHFYREAILLALGCRRVAVDVTDIFELEGSAKEGSGKEGSGKEASGKEASGKETSGKEASA